MSVYGLSAYGLLHHHELDCVTGATGNQLRRIASGFQSGAVELHRENAGFANAFDQRTYFAAKCIVELERYGSGRRNPYLKLSIVRERIRPALQIGSLGKC